MLFFNIHCQVALDLWDYTVWSTPLLHLAPLRFHCVGGAGIESPNFRQYSHWQSKALTIWPDLIHMNIFSHPKSPTLPLQLQSADHSYITEFYVDTDVEILSCTNGVPGSRLDILYLGPQPERWNNFTDGWLKPHFVIEILVRPMSRSATATSSQSVSCMGR